MAGHPNNTRGIRIDGAVNTVGDIKLKGTSVGNEGVLVFAPVSVKSGSLSIDGTMTASGGGWRSGVAISQNITLSESTTLTVVGRADNPGATLPEWGVNLSEVILQALDINGNDEVAGNVSITGTTTSGANSEGVLLNGSITTAGKITVVGQTPGTSRGGSVLINANLTSEASDIVIQSIGGRIQQAAAATLKAQNISVDNTGGNINATTGAITAGSGTHTLATTTTGDLQNNSALILAGTLDASGNINVRGNKKELGVAISVTSGAVLKTSSANAQININSDKNISSAGTISASAANSEFNLNALNISNIGKISSSATDAVVTLNAGSISSTSVDGIDLVGSSSLLAIATAGDLVIRNSKMTGSIFASAAGNIDITNVGAVTLSASTNDNGDILVNNSGGTLSLGTVNGQSGIAAHGTGDVTLTGTSSIGDGVVLRNGVDVAGRNITLSGRSNNSTGFGFQGEGGALNATGSLSLTGIAAGSGNGGSGDGFYNFRGLMTAANGVSITGTSGSGKSVSLDATAQVTNGSSGNIVITGSSSTDAISLRGMSISNGGADITLTANQGQIYSDTCNPIWGFGANLPNTITQNGTGIVSLVAGALAADTGAIDGTSLTITQNNNAGF